MLSMRTATDRESRQLQHGVVDAASLAAAASSACASPWRPTRSAELQQALRDVFEELESVLEALDDAASRRQGERFTDELDTLRQRISGTRLERAG
jgi:hypothetical protein